METNIKEDVYKCSKCGLCMSVCPVYFATKNEMYFPRGRYILLNNFFNNRKKLSKKFIKDLDICLYCNSCKDFCPSGIDSREIYAQLKSQYKYNSGFIPFSLKFFFKLLFIKKKSPLIKRIKYKKPLLKEKVVYFQGCINKYINPSDKNATLNILDKLGYEVVKIFSNCCGLPLISDGNISDFNKNASKIEKSIPNGVKYIVCSCDSCFETLNKIEGISSKLIRLDELLKENNFDMPNSENFVYHKPLVRNEECYLSFKIQSLNRKYSCSLMENYFMMKHPDIAEQLLDTVFYKKEEIDNKTIITTCQLDKIGLKKGIKAKNSNATVYSYAEYICLLSNRLEQN